MTVQIRAIDSSATSEIELIASRMHETLAEVLDEARAAEMFTHEQLIDRVLWHLGDHEDRRAAVFVAEVDTVVVGHTIVRVEHEGAGSIGLFATTYVTPTARRSGAASELLMHGEHWMCQQDMAAAATYTEAGNTKLLNLYRKHGYTITELDDEWARAHKPLSDPRL